MAHNGRADRLGSWVARDRGTGNFLGWFMITPVDEPLRYRRVGLPAPAQGVGAGLRHRGEAPDDPR